jgi:hypothetical protein
VSGAASDAHIGPNLAARVRISLNRRQMVQIDSPENESLNPQCGDNAETLVIVGASELTTARAGIERHSRFLKTKGLFPRHPARPSSPQKEASLSGSSPDRIG